MTRRQEALDRSLSLFAGLLDPGVDASGLSAHLDNYRVCITFSERDRLTQTAVTSLASMVARSGMQIIIDAPGQPSVTPLLTDGPFIDALDTHLAQAMPDARTSTGGRADITVGIGDVRGRVDVWLSAGRTEARVDAANNGWQPSHELTALAAAALAATEVHKAALRLLPARHRTAARMLQPAGARFDVEIDSVPGGLGAIDMISAGAITNAALWTLLAIPDLGAAVSVWDDDIVALSNLNRCLLFSSNDVGALKVDALARLSTEHLSIEPIPTMFGPGIELNHPTLVGADRIEARHEAQRARPPILVVGATEAADVVLVSEHRSSDPCAACLHPKLPVADGPVPTASFVSFWAGFLGALRILKATAGDLPAIGARVTRLHPLPQALVHESVQRRPGCEVCGAAAAR